MTDARLCLLQVHAHPDDEASKGAGTNARYAAEGVHTVLVTCTDGAEGDILNHDITVAAFEAAGDPERFPDAGPPFQPLKLYYTGWTRLRLQALHDAFVARGEESPYTDWLAKWDPETPDRPMTTRIDVGDF